jgi:hypothetical protein
MKTANLFSSVFLILSAFFLSLVTCESQSSITIDSVLLDKGQRVRYQVLRHGNIYLKHGSFVLYHLNGQPAQTGYYQNDVAEGNWEYYHALSGKIAAEGKYVKGKRSGHWEFYTTEGNTWLIYDFTSMEPVYFEAELNTLGSRTFNSNDEALILEIERSPFPIDPYTPKEFLEQTRLGQSLHIDNLRVYWQIDSYGYGRLYKILPQDHPYIAELQELFISYTSQWIPAVKDDFMIDCIVEFTF